MAEVIEAGEVASEVITTPSEPVATPVEPSEPAAQPGEVQKVEDLPPWQKALISKEKNERKAAEAERDETRRQLAQLTETVARLTAPKAPDTKPEPRPEQYDSDDAYRDAVTDWKADKKAADILATRQAEDAQRKEQQDIADERVRYAGSVTNAKAKYQDFEEVAASPSLPIPPSVAREILRSSNPAEVQYWLGKNVAEAARIASLPPPLIAREIGRIEGRLEAPVPAKPPAVSKAPPPVQPVGAANQVEKNLYTMSAAEIYDELQRESAQKRRR